MQIQTLGYQTEWLFHRFESEIRDRGDYQVVRTPQNPSYHWGNLLLFPAAPQAGDFERWTRAFASEFQDLPKVRHQTFAWDDPQGPSGESASFLAAGFEDEGVVVLTAAQVIPPERPHPGLAVRPLADDSDWQDALALLETCHPEQGDYLSRQMAFYRRMAMAGLGDWYGGYLQERLVGALGIYQGDRWGRFQQVHTHPDDRQQGICSHLVQRVAQLWLNRPDIDQLVIMAEPESQAERIYRSVGFQPVERLGGLTKSPPPSVSTV